MRVYVRFDVALLAQLRVLLELARQGILYRDIKPDNMMIGSYDEGKAYTVYMIDYGTAVQQWTKKQGKMKSNQTGTWDYMSANVHITGSTCFCLSHRHAQ